MKKYSQNKNYKVIAYCISRFHRKEQNESIAYMCKYAEEYGCKVLVFSTLTDLYFDALDKYNNEFLKSRNVSFNSSELGCWIKFNEGREGTRSLIKDSQDLGNLIRDTPWCTRKSPEEQLKSGDFYVFVDTFTGIQYLYVDGLANNIIFFKGGI